MRATRWAVACGLTLAIVLFGLHPGARPSLRAAKPSDRLDGLRTLQPGQFREINQNLKINVVFVGFHPGTGPRDIDEAAVRRGLPHHYRTVDVSPAAFIDQTRDVTRNDPVWIGTAFDYDYNFVYANQQFEDAFFQYLPTVGIPCLVTVYQQYYNTQNSRSLDITDNTCVEATLTEAWLGANAPGMLGVDTTKYTVFLINWYGRSDFRFHTYLPFAYPDPDPDTGFTWAYYQVSELNAWGGTPPDDPQNGLGALRRVWFYDLSAGPDYNSVNYAQDTADQDGDGHSEYTIPPVWEYGNLTAYRPFNDLSGDLSKVIRFVAIDSLFTKSPILPPAISPPEMPNRLQIDLTHYDGDLPARGRDYVTTSRLLSEVGAARPYNTFSAWSQSLKLDGPALDIYTCALPSSFFPNPWTQCYGNRPVGGFSTFADVFLFLSDRLNRYTTGASDHDIPVIHYMIPDALSASFLGLADDDHTDGRSASFVYMSDYHSHRNFLGMTETAIHEVGHYLGMTHPHDGYDWELGTYFSPATDPSSGDDDQYFFAWIGDASDSIMSYTFLNNGYSQFDRDNMNRDMTAVYINQANAVLPRILSDPRAPQVTATLLAADQQASQALFAYDQMDYATAVLDAKAAYDNVIRAAHSLHVTLEPGNHSSRRPWGRRKGLDDGGRFDRLKQMQRTPGGFARIN